MCPFKTTTKGIPSKNKTRPHLSVASAFGQRVCKLSLITCHSTGTKGVGFLQPKLRIDIAMICERGLSCRIPEPVTFSPVRTPNPMVSF